MLKALKKVFGSKNEREINKLKPVVEFIHSLEPEFQALSDDQLKAKTGEFMERIEGGEPVDSILPEAFAALREASVRVMGMRHYDVQMMGGIILNRGSIAEMRTGEGKTLTATLPVYLNALTRRGVHVVTVNDYLAKRDSEWMGRLYNWMGLSTGCILNQMSDDERKAAYECDITYGTNNEFGFDYLRDNMKFQPDTLVQREFHFAIVDEVDSVLIDEARTPLIISGPSEGNTQKYYDANQLVLKLSPEHADVDEKDHLAMFNEAGIKRLEELLKVENLYDIEHIQILHALEQALRAHNLFTRDVDYVVKEGAVVIIDSHTGRPQPGRRYSDGLHQALEAKEGVTIEKENQTLASVTYQNFFRMYEKLSGMTGTAETEATEFQKIYKLETYVIPTNKPMIRDDRNDQVYGSNKAKLEALVEQIQTENAVGRPVLVGTVAIESSEQVSQFLTQRGIKHVVLNAKFHAQESEIVAQAGRLGAVTIATNMAGRGTDIILGGNPEMLAQSEAARNKDADYEELLAKYTAQCEADKKKVLELGGLAILGTERHDSRRIDNQLRGRAGRQGDPGMSLFFLSLEDKLLRLFGNERMKKMMKAQMTDGLPIEHSWISKAIERAQKSVEGRHFEARKHTLEYDDVNNKQRNTFYALRRQMLFGNAREYLFKRARAIVEFTVNDYLALQKANEDDRGRVEETLKSIFAFELPEDRKIEESLIEEVITRMQEDYSEKWDHLGLPEDVIENHERFIMLYMIDQQWKDHMRVMDSLERAVKLQGYAQQDPLTVYKRDSFKEFNALMDRLDEEVVKTLVHVRPQLQSESLSQMKREREKEEKAMQMAGGGEDKAEEPQNVKAKPVRRTEPKVGRNEPCPCGSGKKYKKCHGLAKV
ncbi:preprotein translocase subunit SecA [Acanthopleuribacter pedis]|uniref:Protein translocase subunit SecA n=1 Tax=Acanthopleuribacter pedis TaxID=442870 RepID=A0A8J7U676_9BACT|nr:preprotein translocase subunit SecA [Acanthopleuribacter pedis]MBO1322502.1 preprotein translocase subunit SecA [Acanthopleuribacter pedis]